MKQFKLFLFISFFIACDSFEEEIIPLEVSYYINDGWIAFESENYFQAYENFIAAKNIENNNSINIFLALIGLGWTLMDSVNMTLESNHNVLISSGLYFDSAFVDIEYLKNLYNIQGANTDFNDDLNYLNSGLTLQRALLAKNYLVSSETIGFPDSLLNDTIKSLYLESIFFSNFVTNTFSFQYNRKIEYRDILLVKIQNKVYIGEISNAVQDFINLGFSCDQEVNEDTIIECLCYVSNGGYCPFN